MNATQVNAFPAEVIQELGSYVYRLIDPRNGETFYVGKGKGNRVFQHAREQIDQDAEELDPKLGRIRVIRLAGFDVAHVIHRHGMDESAALEVEAALIDAYSGLTNEKGGNGNSDYGAMHVQEIIERYKSEPADIQHKAILINVNRSSPDVDLYEATRYAWKMKKEKAEHAEIVLAVKQGVIVGAFKPTRWLEATVENFPGHEPVPGRIGFEGVPATADVAELYVRKLVPQEYRKRGAANPIRYTW